MHCPYRSFSCVWHEFTRTIRHLRREIWTCSLGRDHAIDIGSISFGGYLYRSVEEEDQTYKQYVKTVNHARSKGTIIVASAGNDHVRIGAGGKVLSHGSLTTPGRPVVDLYGLWETPGGIPGVVLVYATANLVNPTQRYCFDSDINHR